MHSPLPSRLFIAGTDTGVGKTLVAAALTLGLGANYWKPVQSGLETLSDTEWVRRATGLGERHFIPETYRLRHPLSPHLAAAREGVRIELEHFHLPDAARHPRLVVEGAGGLMVPLNENYLLLDLMQRLALPVLLVARSGLGTINHVLLSLEQLRRCGLPIAGVVLNGPPEPDNGRAIEHYGRVALLAVIEPLARIAPEVLSALFLRHFGAPA